MGVNLVMPSSLDALHVVLAALVVLLFIVALMRGGKTSPDVGNESGQAEGADAAATEDTTPVVDVAPALKTSDPDSALQLLGLLQQEARFIDFLNEDLTGFSDAEIGAVARVVHEGGKKLLDQYFSLQPVRSEDEESTVMLEAGFNSAENRVTGNVLGEPPFKGVLVHRGWRAVKADLPKLASGHDARVIAPAEVEL
ncbi:DUF2760 domain-containing protein [Ketobacter sp.]|nr:MAG: DUF2760 domain-containing protein [Ketobacter sp.]